jgi:hypothetical protein
MKVTIRGKLVAKLDEQYTTMVFQNLDEPNNSLLRYITVTKLPNWTGVNPEIGDIGFIECEYVNAGDEYYQRNTGNKEMYKYTQCYFLNFIKEQKEIVNNNYKF